MPRDRSHHDHWWVTHCGFPLLRWYNPFPLLQRATDFVLSRISSYELMLQILLPCCAFRTAPHAASHLPFNRNGLKFFTASGGASKADISAILSTAAELYPSMSEETVKKSTEASEAATSQVDYMRRYTADLVQAVRRGAGAGGRLALLGSS